jgi:hypothetical protein
VERLDQVERHVDDGEEGQVERVQPGDLAFRGSSGTDAGLPNGRSPTVWRRWHLRRRLVDG